MITTYKQINFSQNTFSYASNIFSKSRNSGFIVVSNFPLFAIVKNESGVLLATEQQKPGFKFLTDTGEDQKLVHRRKLSKMDTSISSSFFRRVRATSMTQRRVENTCVHFWMFSPVSVNKKRRSYIIRKNFKSRDGIPENSAVRQIA